MFDFVLGVGRVSRLCNSIFKMVRQTRKKRSAGAVAPRLKFSAAAKKVQPKVRLSVAEKPFPEHKGITVMLDGEPYDEYQDSVSVIIELQMIDLQVSLYLCSFVAAAMMETLVAAAIFVRVAFASSASFRRPISRRLMCSNVPPVISLEKEKKARSTRSLML